MQLPDLQTFARKHVRQARTRGVRPALRSAVTETALWTFSNVYPKLYGRGRRIWEDDWDVCCVLDACRYDAWRMVRARERARNGHDWLPAGSAWSVGSASPEWYGHTFRQDVIPADEAIGVVTANPFSCKPAHRAAGAPPDSLPLVEGDGPGEVVLLDEVWRDHWGTDAGAGYLDVTDPRDVTARAARAWRDHDLDRLVVHFMQPHIPFRSRPEWFGVRENLAHFGEPSKEGNEGRDPWKLVRDGELPADEFWEAYLDNLVWGLDHVDRLRRAVDGTLLVTSDHGNAMGEWECWSHPPERWVPELRRVPWGVVDGTAEDDLEALAQQESEGGGKHHAEDVEEKLSALGYRSFR